MADDSSRTWNRTLAGAATDIRGWRVTRTLRANRWAALTLVLLLLQLILIACTFLDYGITYDEDWHSTYGEYIVQWYKSGFRDTRALTYWTLPLQAEFFGTTARLVSRLSPLGVFETSHLINALFGLLGVIGAFKLGELLAGPLAGFLSALFLLATPRYYGHAFNNPVDIPMAVFAIFAIYYLIRLVYCLPRVPWNLLVKLGIAVGLALAVRVGAVILVFYVGLAFCLWLIGRYILSRRGGQPDTSLRSAVLRLGVAFVGICLIAYLIMTAWWPAAQVRPVVQPWRGLRYATSFGYEIDVLFEGSVLSNMELPWYYSAKWFLITLPEFYFIALAIGLGLASVTLARTRRISDLLANQQVLGILILLACVALPLAYTTLTRPVDYDGVRHYLFLIPPLAALAAVSVAKLVERRPRSPLTIVAAIAILASVTLTAIDMVQLHPHQYVYFNRAFGRGVAEAAKSYDTDYWGNSYKEGVTWLVNNYQDRSGGRPKVASCSYSLSTSYYLPEDRFEYVGAFHDGDRIAEGTTPDLLLATTRWDCHKKLPGRVLHVVMRKGAPLLYVIEITRDATGDEQGSWCS